MAKYTVVAGDSLSKIARDVLGNIDLWPQLAKWNFIDAPYTIFPGQVLSYPDTIVTAPTELEPIKPDPTPVARMNINWPLIALALLGFGLLWFGMKK